MPEYYNVTTNLGDAEIANAIATNTKLDITHVAFGDGNGSVPTPNKTRTTLVREVHRQAVTKYERHATNANWIVIETIIPSDVGGFTIREMGIIANGKLISHGSHAPFEKVADPSGVSEYRLRFTQNVTDGSVVELTLDESLIYATQAWIDENYIKRSEVVDNLTTGDATKVVSAKQAKKLQDEKAGLSTKNTYTESQWIDKRPLSEFDYPSYPIRVRGAWGGGIALDDPGVSVFGIQNKGKRLVISMNGVDRWGFDGNTGDAYSLGNLAAANVYSQSTNLEWLFQNTFGILQSVRSVTTERVPGVTYTNPTSRLIFVSVSFGDTGNQNAEGFVIVNGVTWGGGKYDSGATTSCLTVVAPVPAGGTYRIDVYNGGYITIASEFG